MTKRGRPKQPTALKILHGNPGKRPIEQNEVKPNPWAPIMPDWLSDEAKAEWNRIAPKLERLGLLTELDGSAFAAYCQSYARWVEAEEFIAKTGLVIKTPNGHVQQSPYLSISNRAMANMSGFLTKFGMSPSDRVGLVDPRASEKQGKFANLLSG